MAYGKWIGGFLGLLHGGPLGALAGFAIGALVDSMWSSGKKGSQAEAEARQAEGERNGFLFSLMVLALHVIHADGKVMHSEMECMRRFLRMNFGEEAERQGEQILLQLLERKKQMGESQWNAYMDAVGRQIGGVMPREQRLQLVAFLCEIAKADNVVVEEERAALRGICAAMGLDPSAADQMLGLGGKSLDEAYQVLGLQPDASDDEVRKAYKRMALENHPDHVAALGEDIRQAAERKLQEINEAKERIYKARGMK